MNATTTIVVTPLTEIPGKGESMKERLMRIKAQNDAFWADVRARSAMREARITGEVVKVRLPDELFNRMVRYTSAVDVTTAGWVCSVCREVMSGKFGVTSLENLQKVTRDKSVLVHVRVPVGYTRENSGIRGAIDAALNYYEPLLPKPCARPQEGVDYILEGKNYTTVDGGVVK